VPEASIVIKSTDRYSDAVKKMATVTRSFSKDVTQKSRVINQQRIMVPQPMPNTAFSPGLMIKTSLLRCTHIIAFDSNLLREEDFYA